jgi:hypothetical protein
MSKRDKPYIDNERFSKQIEKVEAPKKEKESTLPVQSLIDAKIIATGYVTGNSYVFNGAGSVVDVDERDVENLLSKRQGGRQCCGGTDYGNAMFTLAEVI